MTSPRTIVRGSRIAAWSSTSKTSLMSAHRSSTTRSSVSATIRRTPIRTGAWSASRCARTGEPGSEPRFRAQVRLEDFTVLEVRGRSIPREIKLEVLAIEQPLAHERSVEQELAHELKIGIHDVAGVLIGSAFCLAADDFLRQIAHEGAPRQGTVPPASDEHISRDPQAQLHQRLRKQRQGAFRIGAADERAVIRRRYGYRGDMPEDSGRNAARGGLHQPWMYEVSVALRRLDQLLADDGPRQRAHHGDPIPLLAEES